MSMNPSQSFDRPSSSASSHHMMPPPPPRPPTAQGHGPGIPQQQQQQQLQQLQHSRPGTAMSHRSPTIPTSMHDMMGQGGQRPLSRMVCYFSLSFSSKSSFVSISLREATISTALNRHRPSSSRNRCSTIPTPNNNNSNNSQACTLGSSHLRIHPPAPQYHLIPQLHPPSARPIAAQSANSPARWSHPIWESALVPSQAARVSVAAVAAWGFPVWVQQAASWDPQASPGASPTTPSAWEG